MGYNIGVSSLQTGDCDGLIDRGFYNFVASKDTYGEKSILFKTGEYYHLDLTPLTKMVYTWDDVEDDEIMKNLQLTKHLIELVEKFKDKIIQDNSVCKHIEYVWYDVYSEMTDAEYNLTIQKIGKEREKEFAKMIEQNKIEQKRLIEENPNTWQSYFEKKHILKDLM